MKFSDIQYFKRIYIYVYLFFIWKYIKLFFLILFKKFNRLILKIKKKLKKKYYNIFLNKKLLKKIFYITIENIYSVGLKINKIKAISFVAY